MSTETTPPTPCPDSRGETSATFRTTRWTQVARAKVDSPEGRNALAELCKIYYEPVATFIRYELRDADAAQEIAHEFFAQALAGGSIDNARQERGRFRSYLLGAVKHFLSHHRKAQQRLKRGGGTETVSLNEMEAGSLPEAKELTPDAAYDRKWALIVVANGFEALRNALPKDALNSSN